jgi:hypothetical protein
MSWLGINYYGGRFNEKATSKEHAEHPWEGHKGRDCFKEGSLA